MVIFSTGVVSGKVNKDGKAYEIDFWNAYGIYVLHNEFRPIYVGKAATNRLGARLREHLTDRHAGRWDMFSWFSLSGVNTTSKNVRKPGIRQVKESTVASTLEALSILITDPPMNRKRESIPAALEAKQMTNPYPRTVRNYLEQILARMDEE